MNDILKKGQEAIEHFGTKGMRWGVRKSRRSSSAESKASGKLRKKKAFELTDAELKKVNARLSLEKSYSQLNPSATSKAAKVVVGVLGSIAKQTATEIGTKYARKILSWG